MCVVMVHSITRTIEINGNHAILLDLRLLLTFGTPIFIMLSEFLIAYKNKTSLPKGFIKKRFKYLFIPYVTMAFLYAFVMCLETKVSVFSTHYLAFVLRNLAFGFYRHGYFLLVIVQFYWLHALLGKRLMAAKPYPTLFMALLINVAYLSIFNFIDPTNIPYGALIWRGLSWGFFPSWIFYFVLGYYMALYFEALILFLKSHRLVVWGSAILSGLAVLTIYHKGWITLNESKRIDMLLFSTLMTFALLTLPIKKSAFIEKFSTYTFAIYLYHMFYLFAFTQWFAQVPTLPTPLLLMLLFGLSTMASIATLYFFGHFKWGYVFIGAFKKSSP